MAVRKVSIREARAHLSKLVEQAANGEPFVIEKAGKPLVKVTKLAAPAIRKTRPLGFLKGRFTVPDDFDRMGGGEIERLLGVDD